jgi:lipoprotein-anchoring transpeptidase ErfK/SrfK
MESNGGFRPFEPAGRIWGLSGHHLVSDGRQLGRAIAKESSSAMLWARRIGLLTAATLVTIPEAARAQTYWNWGPGDYYGRRYYEPRYRYYEPRYYEQRPSRPKRAKIKRKDPAEAAARNAAKPVGPLVIAVSVAKQRVKVYDSNGLFAEAPVSTGTKSNPTPYGVFSIIQKNRHHVSNLYGASMPYMQRITWSGVAMHTGPLPGYAASHGCIRMPNEFAARLWTWTKMGTRVIVAPGEVSPANFSHPKLVARMAPPPTLSTAPAPGSAEAAGATQPRTADAREALASIKGTLTDVAQPAAGESKMTQGRAPEAAFEASSAKASSPDAAEAKLTEMPADAKSAEKSARKIAESSTGGLAVKPEHRTNTDESTGASAKKSEASPKSAADPAGAKPADIAKSPEITRSANAAPAAASRRHNHVAVFISRKDKKLYIRHGYEPVFDTPIEIADADRPLGTHVFTARGDKDDARALHWSVVSLPQVMRRSDARRSARRGSRAAPAPARSNVIPALDASEALDRVTIPDEALEKIASIISPGGSLLISDHGHNGWETGKGTDFIVPLR